MAGGLVVVALAVAYQVRSDGGSGGGADDPDERAEAVAAGGGVCVAAPCKASNDQRPTRGYESPAVVADPQDPDHLVVTDDNLVGGQCGWHVSFTGGAEWEDGVFALPAGFKNCGLDDAGLLPAGNVVIGPSGAVYSVFTSQGGLDQPDSPRQGESVLFVSSTDGGRSFAPARVAVPSASPSQAYTRPLVNAVAGPDGMDRLLLTFWGCEPGLCQKGYFAQSRDGGQTFSAPVLVTPDPGGNSPSKALLAPDGTIYMTFLKRYNDGPTDAMLARSTDGGASFTSAAFDTQQNVGLEYDTAKLALDPTGEVLYAVYADKRAGNTQIYFRRSRDQGVSFEPPVYVNTITTGESYAPEMSVAPDGRIDVVFYHARSQEIDDVLWSYSTDAGITFSRNRQINAAAINRSIGYRAEIGRHYKPAVTSVPSGPIAVWSDTREGNPQTDTQDVVLRRVEVTR